MRRVGLEVLALSMLLGAPMTVHAKEKAERRPKVETIVLGFGWPDAFAADVTYRWTRTRTAKPAQGVTLVGRLKVAVEGENLRIEYRDWKPQGPGNGAGAPPNALMNAAPVVTRKGAVVRVDGAAPPTLKATTARVWQMLVGSWAGVALEVGKDYVTTTEGPVPLVPGGKLKTTLRFRAERLLDCPGKPGVRCVELKMRSEPDRKSLARLVAASLKTGPGDKVDGNGGDMGAYEESTLVAEPDRLIPYRLAITKTITLRPSPGDAEPALQVDRTTWTYDYPAGTKP